MLLRQNLGRRHQGALPAGVYAFGGGQRRNHGFAGADIALQQAVHGDVASQVEGDFAANALLRSRQLEGDDGQQLVVQGICSLILQHRRSQRRPLPLRLQLRQLLRQKLLRFEPLPRGVGAVFQLHHRHIRRRMMQK